MTEAIANKGKPFGEQFRKMSDAEAGHANALLKMLNSKENRMI